MVSSSEFMALAPGPQQKAPSLWLRQIEDTSQSASQTVRRAPHFICSRWWVPPFLIPDTAPTMLYVLQQVLDSLTN
jgi:hypothetical protein